MGDNSSTAFQKDGGQVTNGKMNKKKEEETHMSFKAAAETIINQRAEVRAKLRDAVKEARKSSFLKNNPSLNHI